MKPLAICTLLLTFGSPAFGQHHQPYSGMQSRDVKALSEQQIGDLKAGRGMGLALAAELNGYPGPIHVLELCSQLGQACKGHPPDTFRTGLLEPKGYRHSG